MICLDYTHRESARNVERVSSVSDVVQNCHGTQEEGVASWEKFHPTFFLRTASYDTTHPE